MPERARHCPSQSVEASQLRPASWVCRTQAKNRCRVASAGRRLRHKPRAAEPAEAGLAVETAGQRPVSAMAGWQRWAQERSRCCRAQLRAGSLAACHQVTRPCRLAVSEPAVRSRSPRRGRPARRQQEQVSSGRHGAHASMNSVWQGVAAMQGINCLDKLVIELQVQRR